MFLVAFQLFVDGSYSSAVLRGAPKFDPPTISTFSPATAEEVCQLVTFTIDCVEFHLFVVGSNLSALLNGRTSDPTVANTRPSLGSCSTGTSDCSSSPFQSCPGRIAWWFVRFLSKKHSQSDDNPQQNRSYEARGNCTPGLRITHSAFDCSNIFLSMMNTKSRQRNDENDIFTTFSKLSDSKTFRHVIFSCCETDQWIMDVINYYLSYLRVFSSNLAIWVSVWVHPVRIIIRNLFTYGSEGLFSRFDTSGFELIERHANVALV